MVRAFNCTRETHHRVARLEPAGANTGSEYTSGANFTTHFTVAGRPVLRSLGHWTTHPSAGWLCSKGSSRSWQECLISESVSDA